MRAGFFAVALALSLPAQAADWKTVEGADFTVSFPGEAKPSQREDEAQIGKVKSQLWTVEQEHETFTLSIADYPAELVKKSLPAKILESARDGAVANLGGTLEKDFAVFLEAGEAKKKWPGREFSFHTEKGISHRIRLYLVGDKLYMLLFQCDETVKDEGDFTRFFDSLKLKGSAKEKKDKKKEK